MADKMKSNSPYNYVFNNPVLFVYPDSIMTYANYGAMAYPIVYLLDKGSINGKIRSHLYDNNDADFLLGFGGSTFPIDEWPSWDIDIHICLIIAKSD